MQLDSGEHASLEETPLALLISSHPFVSKAPFIRIHRATHHGLAQAIGRSHEDHIFEAALRV